MQKLKQIRYVRQNTPWSFVAPSFILACIHFNASSRADFSSWKEHVYLPPFYKLLGVKCLVSSIYWRDSVCFLSCDGYYPVAVGFLALYSSF